MLNQATSDRVELAHLLNISNTQLGYVTNSDAGQGLIFSGDCVIPFIDKFPTNTKLYSMMTTKLDEIEASKEKDKPKGPTTLEGTPPAEGETPPAADTPATPDAPKEGDTNE
jgi:hypothetical protein